MSAGRLYRRSVTGTGNVGGGDRRTDEVVAQAGVGGDPVGVLLWLLGSDRADRHGGDPPMRPLRTDPPLKIGVRAAGPMVAFDFSRPVEALVIEPSAAVEIARELLCAAAHAVVAEVGRD